ncbi:Uncharacterised protein [Collinsella aerofaciens]|nr:Uncharacterised protein [Collinsella aerofaciens]
MSHHARSAIRPVGNVTEIFSKKISPHTLRCAIVQRNSNEVRPHHGITKGATNMKNTMKSLSNWWWRDANTIGRQ